jgi:hypothetical protein
MQTNDPRVTVPSVRTTIRRGAFALNDNETIVPSGAPAANGATADPANPATGSPAAPPAPTPANSASIPDPTSAAAQAGRTDYRQRMIGTLQRLGIPLVDGAPGKPSVNKSLEAAAQQLRDLQTKVAANSGLDDAERARIATLETQLDEWKKAAATAETEKSVYIRRQEVAKELSGREAKGALDTAIDVFLREYESAESNGVTFYRFGGQVMVNPTTGQYMTTEEAISHMLARHTFLARPGAQPGIVPVGNPVATGDLEARIKAATSPAERFELTKQLKKGLS